MKQLVFIALFVSSIGFGQDTIIGLPSTNNASIDILQILPNYLPGEVEDLTLGVEFNRYSSFGLRDHSFLKPYISIAKPSTYSYKKIHLRALVDGNSFYSQASNSDGFGYRVGAGVHWNALWNQKLHVNIKAVQGIYGGDSSYRPKSYLQWKSGNTGWYTDIRSRVSYTPNQIFNFQVGVDHNFYGEGSRSLFLSDFGNPYPFGLIRARFWRAEYSILYQFLREGTQNNWKGKFASTHHISVNATNWLNIGIFETVVFNPKDTLLHRGFDVEYLNPIVFYRPQEYAIGSSDNVLLGIDLTARFRGYTLYTQFILDEFYLAEIRAHSQWWANKFGGQLGMKKTFRTQKGRLYVRTEFNFVRPYTYAHLNPQLNYGNQGLPLAHPYGANFAEILGEVNYHIKLWDFYGFVSYSLQGGDANGYNYGGDIYEPYVNRPYEYGHFIGQGNQQNSILVRASASRLFPKLMYSTVFAETNMRYNVQSNTVGTFILVGVRTKLWNDYRNY